MEEGGMDRREGWRRDGGGMEEGWLEEDVVFNNVSLINYNFRNEYVKKINIR